jgi:hypothetical protein
MAEADSTPRRDREVREIPTIMRPVLLAVCGSDDGPGSIVLFGPLETVAPHDHLGPLHDRSGDGGLIGWNAKAISGW